MVLHLNKFCSDLNSLVSHWVNTRDFTSSIQSKTTMFEVPMYLITNLLQLSNYFLQKTHSKVNSISILFSWFNKLNTIGKFEQHYLLIDLLFYKCTRYIFLKIVFHKLHFPIIMVSGLRYHQDLSYVTHVKLSNSLTSDFHD